MNSTTYFIEFNYVFRQRLLLSQYFPRDVYFIVIISIRIQNNSREMIVFQKYPKNHYDSKLNSRN